ncbi:MULTISPECIES: LysR substrate-binding domain-containing protein [Neptunomonas]|uniref:LysR substrate-binding domain-containing protein n=1 Tax=Neptunomonas TaxID=75687 RepID=UPI000948F6A9|nr:MULTISPECIES: LysR substrate-binding domain-containing protein [Neptunomonas]MDN2658619.1 LysR substrate-binding domain-containing protein [Neptunomonas sp. CHC150]
MRFKGLDLNLLVALDALISERNITRAGERIHLSQSGMSSAVSRLRQYFNDELFVLVGRDLVPTPLAESLSKSVRRILIDMENTIINKPQFDPKTDDRCYRVIASELTTMVLMPSVVSRLAQESPHLRLEILTTGNEDLLDKGDIDLMFIPRQFVTKGHPYDEIYQEGYKCICWEGNTTITDKLTFEDYQSAGHVAVNYGKNHAPAFDGWFMGNYGVSRRVEITTSNLLAPPMLIIGTQRIATVHSRLADIVSQSMPIRVLEPPMEIPLLTQTMQYHRDRENDEGLRWLRALIADVALTI